MAKKTLKPEAKPKVKKSVPAAKPGKAASKKAIDTEIIRKKAEEIYYERIARGEHGTAEDDWHMAEKLLKAGPKKTAVKKPVAKKPAVKKAAPGKK